MNADMLRAASLTAIARKAAKGLVGLNRPTELSMSLSLLRAWCQAEIRGAKRCCGQRDAVEAEIRAEYSAACELMGGVL